MKLDIRKLAATDEDCRAWVDVGSAYVPDRPPEDLEDFRTRLISSIDEQFPHLYAISYGAQIIGCGQVHLPKFAATDVACAHYDLLLLPEHEALNVAGESIHTHVEEYVLDLVAGLGVRFLTVRIRGDRQPRVDWHETHGYRCLQREVNSKLQVQDFDFSPWQTRIKSIEDEGIVFSTVSALADEDPHWRFKLRHAWIEVDADVPRPYGPPTMSETDFDKMVGKASTSLESWMVAVDRNKRDTADTIGAYAAFTAANRFLSTPSVWDIRMTGVRPDWRRRGLATVLKLKSIEQAKREGVESIVTGNEENNPTLRVNLQMGFSPMVSILQYERRLDCA